MEPARSQIRPVRLAGSVGLVVVALAIGLGACGGGKGSTHVALGVAGRRGQQVAAAKGCASCHTTSGQRATGPTWKGLAGSRVTLADGRSITATDAYLERSIRDPGAQVVAGYARGVMPTIHLSAAQLSDVIAYLHDLAPAGPTG